MTITREQIIETIEKYMYGTPPDYEIRGEEQAAEAILALIEKERDPLVDELVALFEWSDTFYLHVLLHIKNAVLNERATASSRISELERAVQEIGEVLESYPTGKRLATIERIVDRVTPPTLAS